MATRSRSICCGGSSGRVAQPQHQWCVRDARSDPERRIDLSFARDGALPRRATSCSWTIPISTSTVVCRRAGTSGCFLQRPRFRDRQVPSCASTRRCWKASCNRPDRRAGTDRRGHYRGAATRSDRRRSGRTARDQWSARMALQRLGQLAIPGRSNLSLFANYVGEVWDTSVTRQQSHRVGMIPTPISTALTIS